MAKSKRKTSTPKEGVSTKKKRDDTSCAQHSGLGFDDLCDNTLLRILSYTDDLRSLISLTRCTSKSLRKRFDLQGDKNAPEYSKLYKKFWQGVFADLQMTPLEETDSKSQDYITAINYRLSLFNNLIGHEKRKKAGTDRSYSLPLRHHNFKPVQNRYSWNYGHGPMWYRETVMIKPFALLSTGTGQDYVQADPNSDSVDVYNDISERARCLVRSIQKKRVRASTSTTSTMKPSQVLLSSFQIESLERNWDEYFGKGTPFDGQYNDHRHEHLRRMRLYVDSLSIDTFDSMDDEGVVLKEKRIVLCRILSDHYWQKCTELRVWGDKGCKERSPSKRFELKSIVRIPVRTYLNVVSSNGDKVYVILDGGNPNDFEPSPDKTVYQYSLSANIEDGQQYYVRPECSFQVENLVISIHPYGSDHVLVGTDIGTIEIWDCRNKSHPSRTKTLYATNAFPTDVEENGIANVVLGQGRSQNFFLSAQVKGREGVITLWQCPFIEGRGIEGAADFQMMVKIEYERIINFACNGFYLMVLTFDNFGCLFMDVYHLLGSRYVVNKFDHVKLPKGIEITSLHPKGEQQIQFANRINIRHKAYPIRKFVMDMNDRFIVIEAKRGLDGPGLIIIDLDEHAG